MRHNYTNDDLLRAATAAKDAISDPYKNVPLTYLNHFLNALPKPQTDDGWQPCRFEDIRKGDRVKYETPDALIEPKHPVFRNFGDELAFVGGMKVLNHPDARWYRIPAPVVSPDPEEHPVVIDGNGTAWFWSGLGDEYHSPERPGEYKDRFTNWTPGEVVPKVVETND